MAAPQLPTPLREGDRLTRDEFLRRWEQMPDLTRAELIDGVVHLPSPLTTVHGLFHFRVSAWLGFYVAATPGCTAGIAETWLMESKSAPQPDLALRIDPKLGGQSSLEGEYAAGSPELIVEISHTTRPRDVGPKLRLYERSGVQEYLTVVPRRKELIWRQLFDGKYRNIAPDEEGVLQSRVFPGLWLNPAALWEDDLPGISATVQRGVSTSSHQEFVRRLASGKR
jgi:Uma2 family endonuclease